MIIPSALEDIGKIIIMAGDYLVQTNCSTKLLLVLHNYFFIIFVDNFHLIEGTFYTYFAFIQAR